MEQIRVFSDERHDAYCAHCGGTTETRDHVPPLVFLDTPYPDNLPVVGCCHNCNSGISLDEEYIACLIECVLAGMPSADAIRRRKIGEILTAKPSLTARLADAVSYRGETPQFRIETERVKRVILKLARGHAAFEFSERQHDEPDSIAFSPMSEMDQATIDQFEAPPPLSVWPEIGSRAFIRSAYTFPASAGWQIVQRKNYRYLCSCGSGILVRGVIREYLGFEVIWRGR